MSHGILKKTTLFGAALALILGFVMLAGPVHIAAASAKATNYCKHQTGTAQTACQQGYDGQTNGQDVNTACQSLTGGDLDACQSGWGAAAGEDPAVFGCNASKCDLVSKYINPAINLFSLSFGLVATISIIMGGIQYSASQGDPQKAAAAKSRISNTIIAIFVYLFLYAFLQFLIPGGAFQ